MVFWPVLGWVFRVGREKVHSTAGSGGMDLEKVVCGLVSLRDCTGEPETHVALGPLSPRVSRRDHHCPRRSPYRHFVFEVVLD